MIDEKDLEFNADEDDIIVLQGPDGEEVEFEEIADITLGEHFYVKGEDKMNPTVSLDKLADILGRIDYMNSDEVFESYKLLLGDPIPLYEVMGNKILSEQFDNNPYEVYRYCIKNRKTWQEVLDFTPEYGDGIVY